MIDEGRISAIVELALLEDGGMGDLTSEATIPEDQDGIAEFLCKEQGIVAGLDVVALTVQMCDPGATLRLQAVDGAAVEPGQVIAVVRGDTRALLRAERVALNFLQRMSGIATLTRRYVDAVAGTHARITDTRKTVPGLRVLDKRAVRLGGGVNHRFGLDDMVLIKDNHVAAAGGIRNAVSRCQGYMADRGLRVPVEVETKNLDEVQQALACRGIARIMLDNFPVNMMRQAVSLINGSVEVEASGGITLDTVRAVADTGVDIISVGALTHSVRALDISLELSVHA